MNYANTQEPDRLSDNCSENCCIYCVGGTLLPGLAPLFLSCCLSQPEVDQARATAQGTKKVGLFVRCLKAAFCLYCSLGQDYKDAKNGVLDTDLDSLGEQQAPFLYNLPYRGNTYHQPLGFNSMRY